MENPIRFAFFLFCTILPIIHDVVAAKQCIVCTYVTINKVSKTAREILSSYNDDKCESRTLEDDSNKDKLEECSADLSEYTKTMCGTLNGDVNVTLISHLSNLHIFYRGCLTVEKTPLEICSDHTNNQMTLKSNIVKIFSKFQRFEVFSFSGRRCICDGQICNEDSSARSLYASSVLLLLSFTISLLSQ